MEITQVEPHALAVLIVTALALIAFTRPNIPLETTSLGLIAVLTVGFSLFPHPAVEVADLFSGFGHKALIAVCALMIVGQGLVRTGALEPVGRYLAVLWRRVPVLSLLLTLILTAVLSAFINNTPIVVLMLPLLIGVAVRNGRSPSGTLLPMGMASLLGGMATTIGTSTNLLVVSVAEDMGVAPFSMFDFAFPATIAGAIAIIYLWLIAPRMLPERQPPMVDRSERIFTAQIVLGADSTVAGETLANAILRTQGAMRVEKIQRGIDVFITPLPDVRLRAGDRLTLSDTADNLREFASHLGGELYSGEMRVDEDHPLKTDQQHLAEVGVTAGSSLIGTRISEARLKSRFGLQFLALHRADRTAQRRAGHALGDIALQQGDVLLVQADPAGLSQARRSGELLVLDGRIELPRTSKAPLALIIMGGVIGFAVTGVLSIEVSATLGVLALLATRCLSWQDASRALSVQVIMIVAASLALGSALMATGGADFIARVFLSAAFGAPPGVVLGALMLLMGVMTNVVSNNAAAVIGTPVAIQIASRLGLPMEPFVLAVLFGANLSFATPMAYKTNLLVMNAGGYTFNDFVRVGVPLMFIMLFSLTGLLVYAYQLY